jgi:hypothetical protein
MTLFSSLPGVMKGVVNLSGSTRSALIACG